MNLKYAADGDTIGYLGSDQQGDSLMFSRHFGCGISVGRFLSALVSIRGHSFLIGCFVGFWFLVWHTSL